MKIDNSFQTTLPPLSNRAKARPDTESTANASDTEEVKLSRLAGQLQSGDTNPPFDGARVQAIKQAIVDGRFSIDASAIADRLIDSARDLIGTQRKA